MAPLIAIIIVSLLGAPRVSAQDVSEEPGRAVLLELTSPYEMLLQGDRLVASGRHCLAAERYRAIVGDLPGVFLRWATARIACLEAAGD